MEWAFIGADGALSVPAGALVVIIVSQGRTKGLPVWFITGRHAAPQILQKFLYGLRV